MRTLLVVLIVVVAALAGCAAKKSETDNEGSSGTESGSATKSGSGTKSGSTTKSGTATSSATSTGSSTPKSASLSADLHNGTAPLAVNFTLNATAGSTSWRLSFGDGSIANGTALPAFANHTYAVGGNFSANLTVRYAGDVKAYAATAIAVKVPASTPGTLPDVTHFELGPSAGCAPDGTAIPGVPFYCASFVGGPDADGIDGHWIAVDDRYWGLHLTSATTQSPAGPVAVPEFGNVGADSDCQFVKADETTIIGDASNGSASCDGVVPADTAFVFIYPYAAPATQITVDFVTA